MAELMGLTEQVDRDFATARRRARLRRLGRRLGGSSGPATLESFEERQRSLGAYGGVQRGKDTVKVSMIAGSLGRHDQFDDRFMPLRSASPERWKRIDRAFWSGVELPSVRLYGIDGDYYFVVDGHHRVSVARFHGAEWIDAEITEFRSSKKPEEAAGTRRHTPSVSSS